MSKDELLEKFDSIPYAVINIIAFVSGIATIITTIIGLFQIITAVKSGVSIDINIVLIGVFLVLVFFFFLVLAKGFKYRKLLRNSRRAFAKNYCCFLRSFRNEYFGILSKYKECKGENDSSNLIKGLTQLTRDFMIGVLDQLCDIMTQITGKKVCASVKYIVNTNDVNNEIDINKAEVKTFCRSTNTDTRRGASVSKERPVKIKDNTDFYDILDPESENNGSVFYQRDLKKFDQYLRKIDKKYKNTNENWYKYYFGTIVVPIRINAEHLHFTERDDYSIVGFLCIDSKAKDAFLEKDFEIETNTQILKSFAALLYVVFNKYNYYLMKCGGIN